MLTASLSNQHSEREPKGLLWRLLVLTRVREGGWPRERAPGTKVQGMGSHLGGNQHLLHRDRGLLCTTAESPAGPHTWLKGAGNHEGQQGVLQEPEWPGPEQAWKTQNPEGMVDTLGPVCVCMCVFK